MVEWFPTVVTGGLVVSCASLAVIVLALCTWCKGRAKKRPTKDCENEAQIEPLVQRNESTNPSLVGSPRSADTVVICLEEEGQHAQTEPLIVEPPNRHHQIGTNPSHIGTHPSVEGLLLPNRLSHPESRCDTGDSGIGSTFSDAGTKESIQQQSSQNEGSIDSHIGFIDEEQIGEDQQTQSNTPITKQTKVTSVELNLGDIDCTEFKSENKQILIDSNASKLQLCQTNNDLPTVSHSEIKTQSNTTSLSENIASKPSSADNVVNEKKDLDAPSDSGTTGSLHSKKTSAQNRSGDNLVLDNVTREDITSEIADCVPSDDIAFWRKIIEHKGTSLDEVPGKPNHTSPYRSDPVCNRTKPGARFKGARKDVQYNRSGEMTEVEILYSDRPETLFSEVTSLKTLQDADRSSSCGSLGNMSKETASNSRDDLHLSLECQYKEEISERIAYLERQTSQEVCEVAERIRENQHSTQYTEQNSSEESDDIELTRMVPYPEQALLRFPSERTRGHVVPEQVQVKDSFSIHEMDFVEHIPDEESVAVPREEDSWIALTAETKPKLEKEFRKLMKDMGNGIPDYIQSMFRSGRWYKIYINIDAGSLSQSQNFIRTQCPHYNGQSVLEFVEQTSRPEFLDDPLESSTYTGSTEWRVKVVVRQRDLVTREDKSSFGTMSGIVKCKTQQGRDVYFVMTVMHLFTHDVTEIYLEFTKPDGHEEKFALNLQGKPLGHLGSADIPGETEKKMVDVALLPIQVTDVRKLKDTLNRNRQTLNIQVFEGTDDDLLNRVIQKDGVTTDLTRGLVSFTSSAAINDGGSFCDGIFIQCYKDPRSRIYADKGDSGALVRAPDGEVEVQGGCAQCSGYGLVHKRHKGLRYYNENFVPATLEVYASSTWSVRLYNCVKYLKQIHSFQDIQFLSMQDIVMGNNLSLDDAHPPEASSGGDSWNRNIYAENRPNGQDAERPLEVQIPADAKKGSRVIMN